MKKWNQKILMGKKIGQTKVSEKRQSVKLVVEGIRVISNGCLELRYLFVENDCGCHDNDKRVQIWMVKMS